MSNVFITGATGFVGSNILKSLTDHRVRALVRSPQSRLLEGVEPVVGDVTDPASLSSVIGDSSVVIHLVGIIEEAPGVTFDGIIRAGTENVVNAARVSNVEHFVLMSALGAQDSDNLPYMQAKYRAEEIVKASGLSYTIMRPSVIFGPGDGFINALAGVVKSFPITPVVGDGTTKFQPVAVGDVADAFAAIVNDPDIAKNETAEIGGAEMYSYEQMMDLIAQEYGKSKPKIHVPVGLMKAVVAMSGPLPKALRPPVTPEQLKMLSLDNSTSPDALHRLIKRSPLPLRGNIDYIRSN